jgi:phospholipid/cholesterol/gamma-HCH transport system ATP-binding protein
MKSEPILEFRKATVVVPEPYEFGLEEADFRLNAGELALVAIERGQRLTPIPEVAQGLIEPGDGEVFFSGKNWADRPPSEAAAARGRIGRVFRQGGWISNLNVDENITLPLRHHTELPPEEIRHRAEEMGKQFGLAGLPTERPALCPRSTLRRAEWTRAFLGEPALIILEEPLKDAYSEMLHFLMEGIAGALLRGAAVLWISGDFPVLSIARLSSLKRYRLKGPRLELG